MRIGDSIKCGSGVVVQGSENTIAGG
jgi:hypothetical protein